MPPKKYPRHPCPAFRFILLNMLVNFCGFSPGYKFILLINEWYTSKKKIQSLKPTDHQSRNWTSGIEVTDSLFWKWQVVQHNPRNYRFRNWISGPPPFRCHISTIYLTNSSTILYKLVCQIIKYMDLSTLARKSEVQKTVVENSTISASWAKSYHQIKSNQIYYYKHKLRKDIASVVCVLTMLNRL